MHTLDPLRSDSCAFVFIDHQPRVARPVQPISAATLVDSFQMTGQPVIAEQGPDNTAPGHPSLYPVVLQHGAGVGLAVQHHAAQQGLR